MGYKTQRLRLSTQKHYRVYLIKDQKVLKTVELNVRKDKKDKVATGYQKIEKRKLTGAVDQLKMDDIQQAGVPDISDLIQGQFAGVVVSPQTGAPGALPKIRIRGTASLNGPKEPLWVDYPWTGSI